MESSFFDSNYKTPKWLHDKLSRRQVLKSAAGATALTLLPFSKLSFSQQKRIESILIVEPWLTLDAVLNHLLPESKHGVSAHDIQATYYLYQLVNQQPTAADEVEFIYKGVGWLNGYSEKKKSKAFINLEKSDKELVLRDISRSTAGDNWISMLISNLYESMLSPPSYGGNPKGIGWKWLEHQAGFPLPEVGGRYFELPKRSKTLGDISQKVIPTKAILVRKKRSIGITKA